MRKLVTAFILLGGLGVIAGILSFLKWGIFHLDKPYLLFSLSISGVLVIIGFFGAWVINSFDSIRNRLKDYKNETEKRFDDLEKDMAATQNRLMILEGELIDLKCGKEKGK